MEDIGELQGFFAVTEHEEHFRKFPHDRNDGIPYRYRKIDGRSVPYVPITDAIFANGSTPLISIRRHTRFQHFPEHCHDGVELNYLFAGACTQIVNGETVHLKTGEALFLCPDTVHTILPLSEDDLLINININSEYLMTGILDRLHCNNIVTRLLVDSMENSLRRNEYISFHTADNRRLHSYVENLLIEWVHPGLMARDALESLFILVISEFVASYREQAVQTNDTPMGAALPVLHYLEQNYAHCTLEGTAQALHLHPVYLSALLKEKIGLGYLELVQHLRLDAAENLLLTTNLSITEIARSVGYENVTHFYKLFQRRNGMKPGEFRKRG